MATTEAEVCNIALLRVGERQTLDSLEEDTEPAAACKALYASARDAVLASLWWRFATRRATLAQLASVSRSGWAYAYTVPADCVTARFLWSGQREPAADQRIPFTIEHEPTVGRILLTDQEDAELIYTAQVTNVALFPALFVDALAWRLAQDLALALPVKPNVAAMMDGKYERALARAGAADYRQAQEDAPPDSEFIRVR